MKEDSAWGFALVMLTLFLALAYYKWLWWYSWKKTRSVHPMFGQIWASSSGRKLYVIGVDKANAQLTVLLTDVSPELNEHFKTWRWTLSEWRKNVDSNRLTLEDHNWVAGGQS